jgi:hypothetical protein
MVTKCANPSCNASFQYLRGGKLFRVDLPNASAATARADVGMRPDRTAEYFWLCDECCSQLTLMVDEKGEIGVAKIRSARVA